MGYAVKQPKNGSPQNQDLTRFVGDFPENHLKVVNFEFSMTDPPL